VDAAGRARGGCSGPLQAAGRVPRSGVLRVALVAEAGSATAARSASTERRVRVAAKVGVASRRLHVTAGRRARVSGTVLPAAAGLPVRLEIRRRGGWAAIDSTRTRAGGAYRLADRRSAPGSATVRVRVAAARAGVAPASRSIGRLNVYRHAAASWYGPGLYGNRLGCGGRLGVGTLGVAHKSLPCGTKVTFRKGGRSVRVRVVDRGPYVGGREYDLTAATARRLGFRGHGPVLATR
jgi:hypothetical protein